MTAHRPPPPPRGDAAALRAYLAEHLPRLQRDLRADARDLPQPSLSPDRPLRRTTDPVAEALTRSTDPALHALADAVRRGEGDERELRRHPVVVQVLLERARGLGSAD